MMTDIVEIPLSNSDKYARISRADLPLVTEYTWRIGSTGYVITSIPSERRKANGQMQSNTLGLHRLVLGLEPGDKDRVDIRDGDPLNCTRANLRIASPSVIGLKRKPHGGVSKYKGVTLTKKTGRWAAYIKVEGKHRSLGQFDTEEEAHAALEARRAELL
jgi:hypothetical protein